MVTNLSTSQGERVTPNFTAIVGLLAGIIGVVCVGLGFSSGHVARAASTMVPVLGLCGVVLGVAGTRKARSLGNGRTLALLGLVLSIGLLLTTVVYLILVITAITHLTHSNNL